MTWANVFMASAGHGLSRASKISVTSWATGSGKGLRTGCCRIAQVVAIRIGETHLLDAAVGFRMGADCFPDDVGLARCDLRTEAE